MMALSIPNTANMSGALRHSASAAYVASVPGQDFSTRTTALGYFAFQPAVQPVRPEILHRCIALGKPFALLLSNNTFSNGSCMRALAGVQLQLLMFDRRIEYSATKGTPCGSTYVCRGILPRPLVIEHLERCGKPSAMYDDRRLAAWCNDNKF